MGKITGMEKRAKLPEKVRLLYEAVAGMAEEGADIANLKVSDITERAGIGKGTAYDYFDTKEEIIVYAVLYHMENNMEELEKGIWEEKTFADRVRLALDRTDRQITARTCALRFVNMLFDATQLGQLLRKTLERRHGGRCQPLMFADNVVRKGIADGELRTDLPPSYMTYILVTKFIAYMTYLMGKEPKECSNEEFRDCVYRGILEELCRQQPRFSHGAGIMGGPANFPAANGMAGTGNINGGGDDMSEGTVVFYVDGGQVYSGRVVDMEYANIGFTFSIDSYGDCSGLHKIASSQIGRTVFLNEEDAEAAAGQ